MPEKLTVTPWHRQPRDLMPQSACSPSGRPYSPYPYRDLPKTPSEWPARARTAHTPASHAPAQDFHLFSYLPAELRLQIWREAMLSACSHPRVHRVRLAVNQPPNQKHDDDNNNNNNDNNNDDNNDDNNNNTPPSPEEPAPGLEIEILPTPSLTTSTYATRALLSTCSEARAELLAWGTTALLPDTLPLSGQKSGILRCNLALDILLLDSLDSGLLFRVDEALHCHHQTGLLGALGPLAGVKHLGLDVAPLLEEAEGGCGASSMLFPGAAVSPAVETALVGVVAGGFPAVEGVYLLSSGGKPAIVVVEGGGGVVGPAAAQGQDAGQVVFLGGEGVVVDGEVGRGKEGVGRGEEGVGRGEEGREWYTTRPFPSYYVDGAAYYAHLARVMRFLCQFRQAMDAPAVVTDLDDQEGLERLEGVKLRLLGHYVTGSRDGLELSSPERSLEVALGREPRWIQWEWVCQCLDC